MSLLGGNITVALLDAGKTYEMFDATRRGTALFMCQETKTGATYILASVTKKDDSDGTITLIGPQAPGCVLEWDSGALICDCREAPEGTQCRCTEIRRP